MAATLKASIEGLRQVDYARRYKGWLKSSSEWCEAASTSAATLKRFWRRLPVRSQTFVAICEAVDVSWQEVVAVSPASDSPHPCTAHPPRSQAEAGLSTTQSTAQSTVPVAEVSRERHLDFFAYDEAWVGREAVLAQLSEQLQQSCRLLVLLGITGIGKTALGERLAISLYPQWTGEHWQQLLRENLDNDRQPHDFISVASRWWEHWGYPLEGAKDGQMLVDRTAQYFLNQPLLLIIDSLERMLQGNEEEGWSDFKDPLWAMFFEAVLAAPICQGRIILTSQDFPGQLPARYSNFWTCEFLGGLNETEQLALFAKANLDLTQESQNYLRRIGAAYEGHPLALRVIAGEISNAPFLGNVRAYWNKYGQDIEEVETAIAQARMGQTTSARDHWQLHDCTRLLRMKVRDRLEQTFRRLKQEAPAAYILLCEASVYRCPVAESFWLSHLEDWEYSKAEAQLALDILRDRYLVEEITEGDRLLLRQHNLIRSVALSHLQGLD
ncbi:ATP-binding protein [Sodalinema gerasimenkoae]|uniref:ATP-binding protein n=1 Tax=Sodalinema gerasimenkoae TaxID=2862348 RepID=UPI00135B9C58|nr:ATP-binding protein [Sodalinema gerasimenkoae]